MSVQPGPTFKRHAANGVAPTYTIPFLLLAATDLQITLDGVLVTTGFTLSGIGNPQSSCTFSAPYPSGDLLFQMVIPFQRLTDYQMNGDFLSQTVNPDFDRLWLAAKQLNRDSSRALTVGLLEPEGIPSLPVKAARALKMLAFDTDGSPVTSNLTLEQLEQQPALALSSASQAAASATASATSAGQSNASKDVSALYSAYSQKWAITPENTQITDSNIYTPPGSYSSLHWAAKAAASAAAAAATLSSAVLKTGAQSMAGPLSVTGGITTIPFNKVYVSAPQAQLSAAGATLAHGLGAVPKMIRVVLICTVAEFGFPVGFRMEISPGITSAANSQGISVGSDATNLYLRFGSNAVIHTAINNTTANSSNLTNANWNLELSAYA